MCASVRVWDRRCCPMRGASRGDRRRINSRSSSRDTDREGERMEENFTRKRTRMANTRPGRAARELQERESCMRAYWPDRARGLTRRSSTSCAAPHLHQHGSDQAVHRIALHGCPRLPPEQYAVLAENEAVIEHPVRRCRARWQSTRQTSFVGVPYTTCP